MKKYLLSGMVLFSLLISQNSIAIGCGPYKILLIQPDKKGITIKLKTKDGKEVWKSLGKYSEPSTRYFQAAAQQALATNTQFLMKFDGGSCVNNDYSKTPEVVQITSAKN